MSSTEKEIPSVREYTLVFAALMTLLAITFGLAHVDFGRLSIVISLLIAAAKAVLVALFFMHLRREIGSTRIAACAGVFWLMILLTLALADYVSRNHLPLPSPWPWPP